MTGVNQDETSFAASEQVTLLIADFGDAKPVPSLLFFLPAFDDDRLIDGYGLAILNVHLGGYGFFVSDTRDFAHGFVENDRDDATVGEAAATRIVRAQNERGAGALRVEIEVERQ